MSRRKVELPELGEIITPEIQQEPHDVSGLALRLSFDTALTITDPIYEPLATEVSRWLQSGYRPNEIKAELELTELEFQRLRSRIPEDWWERYRDSSMRHLARKRAALLTNPTHNDLAIVQVLDPQWNPKLDVNVSKSSRPLLDMSDEELKSMAQYE